MELQSTVTDTALLFEGGGMRGVYTAAVVETLVNEGIFIDYVAAVSTGSTSLLNYISRDPARGRKMFVNLADDPTFTPWKSWIRGKGLVDTDFDSYGPDGILPFDYEVFMANPAKMRIGSVDSATGETLWWSKDDIRGVDDLMKKKMAASSPPIYMPAVTVDGRLMIDGSLGEGGGIPLPIALKDGYAKIFAVFTQERGYVMPKQKSTPIVELLFHKHPAVEEAILRQSTVYNSTHEQLLELEREGTACLFFPDHVEVSTLSRDQGAQRKAYDAAKEQASREVPRWKEFLGL